MKSDLIIELNYRDMISNLQDNQLYKYNIDSEGFAEYLVFKKIKNKIIACNANCSENNKLEFIALNEHDIQYTVIEFASVKNENIEDFYQILIEKYNEVMELYHDKKLDNEIFVFESYKVIDKISIEDIQEELSKKYFANKGKNLERWVSKKKYEEILKGNNPVQNALALEYLLLNGRDNLLDDNYYKELQDRIKQNDDRRSVITNGFALASLKTAKDMATLDTKELCQYIYEEEKYKRKQERNR